MRKQRSTCRMSILTACLAGASLAATGPTDLKTAQGQVMVMRADLGLDENHDFVLRSSIHDDLGQTHHRFTQTYQGVKVFGGELIHHVDGKGRALPPTNALFKDIYLNVNPSLAQSEALAIAQKAFGAKGGFGGNIKSIETTLPTAELVVLPETTRALRAGAAKRLNAMANAEDMDTHVLRYTLAYHVNVSTNNRLDGTRAQDYLINAHTGVIIRSWDSFQTLSTGTSSSTPAVGRGNSQYSGTVNLSTTLEAQGFPFGPVMAPALAPLAPPKIFSLRDSKRGTLPHPYYASDSPGGPGNFTGSYNGSGGQYLYTDADNTWGNGGVWDYVSADFSTLGQTAAVDAHFGVATTWDFYKNVFGRNGIDNLGTSVASYVHQGGTDYYPNAGWHSNGFYMSYGDGDAAFYSPYYWNSLTSIDIAGHELTHGVTQYTAGLQYYGEHGGLNEATSDIFGTMVEFYGRAGGIGSTVPSSAPGANYMIGEQIGYGPDLGIPLRWMVRPSLDGGSFDAWDPTIEYYDVHYNSGPMNRAFYFMSQGASFSPAALSYTPYLPTGMTGVGNDHAARIWYRALTTYLTPASNYFDARKGAIQASTDLYGPYSLETRAVTNAFAGINVGNAWGFADAAIGEIEPNDSPSAPQRINAIRTVLGSMKNNSDVDFYYLTVPAGQAINASLIPNGTSDYDVFLFDSNFNLVNLSDYGTGDIDNVSGFNASPLPSTFYVAAVYYTGKYGIAGTYRLVLSQTAEPLFEGGGGGGGDNIALRGMPWQTAIPALKSRKDARPPQVTPVARVKKR